MHSRRPRPGRLPYQRGWHNHCHGRDLRGYLRSRQASELDVDQIVNAFGFAAPRPAASVRSSGTMCKPFHAGKVSHEGVMSGFLAQGGFTSSKRIIEGELGCWTFSRKTRMRRSRWIGWIALVCDGLEYQALSYLSVNNIQL